MLFYAYPRTSALCTLLVPVQFLLVPDNRTVLNVKTCIEAPVERTGILGCSCEQVLVLDAGWIKQKILCDWDDIGHKWYVDRG